MPLNGRALTASGAGLLFIWSGIKGWSVLGTLGDLITGVKPNQQVTTPLYIDPKAPNASTPIAGITNASGLAAIALAYQGHAYRFGGAPGVDGSKPWDCSSFINYVVGVKAGLPIPGNAPGKYSGTTHGPPTGMWALWTGMDTISRSQVAAGDILLWAGHMGMATGHDTMISALNPRLGTRTQQIDSGVGRGPLVRIGRLRNA
jgi:cell wall-associated NlpC family hydrolase